MKTNSKYCLVRVFIFNLLIVFFAISTSTISYGDCISFNNSFQLEDSTASDSSSIKKNYFDEELGFRNESRFIETNSFEFRVTDYFYTQTQIYNPRWLRISNDKRITTNAINLYGAYGFTSKFQGGFQYNKSGTCNTKSTDNALDFFAASADKKFHKSEFQLYGKYKWIDKKYRLTTWVALTLPLTNERPGKKIVAGNKAYQFAFKGLYDSYPTSFMRMIVGAEFNFKYYLVTENTNLDFNPSAKFIFTIFRFKFLKFTSIMDLQFSANQKNVDPFVGIESLIANFIIMKNIDINAGFDYFFIGESTGAGHSFSIGIRYNFITASHK